MLEMIQSGETLIGIFIRGGYSPEKTQFLTPLEEPLQCGIGVFAKGKRVEPHSHVGNPATVGEFQEFIFVRRGRATAEIYDLEDSVIRRIEMEAGDALLLLRGGHAFYFEEDTELLEVKQGPYIGREKMKRVIEATASRYARHREPQDTLLSQS